MADNKDVRDADNNSFIGAADELSDGSFSPKISLVDGTGAPAPISPATSGRQDTTNTSIGATNETAASTDTATAGLNGRLQRIAQRLTSLIAQIPATIGQKAKAASLAVTLASDEDLLGRLPAAASFTDASTTAGTSSASLLSASGTRRSVTIYNASTGAIVSVHLTGGTAAINTAGCVDLLPGDTLSIDGQGATGAFTAKATVASTPVTVVTT